MDLIISFPGGKKVDAQVGNFVVRTDQPVSLGGEGTAPSPFTYCLAAMGTCAGIYVLSYLQARNLPTDGVQIIQEHEVDEKTHKLLKVTMRIQLPATLDQKHHQPLIRSAQQCAVKKLIEEQPQFEIKAEVSG